MALIICPECGHNVSDKADVCPGCGIKVRDILAILEEQEQAKAQPAPANSTPTYETHTPGRYKVVQQETQRTKQQQVQNPAEQPKKSKAILIASFIIALAICGAGYYFYSNAQSQREMDDYEDAMCSNDIMVMQHYLARYAEAPQEHRDSVTARLNMLTMQDNDWTNAVVSGSKGALEEYIKNHPDSPHRGEAMNKIDSIDYAIASRANTTESYSAYLKQHPDGKYASQAQDFIDDKKATEVQPEELELSKIVCKHFFQAINARNESKLLDTVTDYLTSFLNRSGVSNAEVVSFMNKLYKEDITNMNWHILDDFKAEKVKSDDNTYNIRVQFSAEQKIERTDASKEKYGKYVINAEITPEGKITKFTMKKQTTE